MWRSPSVVSRDHCTPSHCAVSPRPPEGSQPSLTLKAMISIRPTQKVGSEKPTMLPAISRRDSGCWG